MEYKVDIQLPCSKHEGYMISHGCAQKDCQKEILFCSQCFLENLEHANEHKHFIYPLGRFIIELNENIQQIRDVVKPFEEVFLSNQAHMTFYQKFMNDQKQRISQELGTIQEQFQFMIEKIKMQSFQELETIESQLINHYENLDTIFNTTEISHLQYTSHNELAQKLQMAGKTQALPFLLDIRSCIQALKEGPQQSQTIKSLQKLTQQIHGYKKRGDNQVMNLEQVVSRDFKNLYQVCEQRVSNYIKDVAHPYDPFAQNNSVDSQQFEQLEPSLSQMQNMQKTVALKNSTKDQNIIESQVYNDPYPVPYTPLNKSVFRNGARINQEGLQEYRGQKNQIIRSENFQINSKNGELLSEAVFESKENMSALCTTALTENLIVVGSKDSLIRVMQITKNHEFLDLELQTVFQMQNPQERAPVWSLAKLKPVNDVFFREGSLPQNTSFFAAGHENGVISIWKYETDYHRSLEQKPLCCLRNPLFTEIVTTLIELDYGSHNLISGDSNGQIVHWDYLHNDVIKKFNLHNGQINSICLYNKEQNFAAGSYDGCISLWTIQREDSQYIDINCIKLINNQSFIYSITSIQNRRGNPLIITDSLRRIKILDPETFQFINESKLVITNEPILDVMTIESQNDTHKMPYLLCFTKTQMAILRGDDLEPVQFYDRGFFDNNNIGFTMCSNHKMVFLPKIQNPRERDISQYFALIDQNNNSNRLVSLFRLNIYN